ncbi:hypothetical protein CKO25_19945 [Thiocapsa imhoffii]|uniref:Uncharacterized protein n=1 Tax=Thiocapsa imhoffii TaxID=382777 RepID=A0A9X0WLE1_9GAMM|nr:hypothetical protein [Thiocapsa imhoffii]MBK1646859.1 hypothetical protein [Thiocapsa imhoffii]
MRTDAEIRSHGIQLLTNALGVVEAERFIALLNRERFDYTKWRQTQWPDENVASLAHRARGLREQTETNAD